MAQHKIATEMLTNLLSYQSQKHYMYTAYIFRSNIPSHLGTAKKKITEVEVSQAASLLFILHQVLFIIFVKIDVL